MRPLLALLLPPLAMLAASAPATAADTVADRVFGTGMLADVTNPEILRYRYELTTEASPQPYNTGVTVDIREIAADGAKKVFFDMFEGQNRRQFGPMEAREQNPLVIVFLQRDVTEMGNLTGGSSLYFQQQIRKAFNGPAEVSSVDVELDGRKVAATRLLIRPFRDDPNVERFKQFRDKAYEFVVTPEVPGGLYRIGSSVPDPKREGGTVLGESMTFVGVEPSTAAPADKDQPGKRS